MSSCCMNQMAETFEEKATRFSDRIKSVAPSEVAVKSFVELLLVATAIVMMALI